MLKKIFKLNTSEFNEVFNFGKTKKTSFCLIKYKENNKEYPRFAVVVSKKIAKKAHDRNLLKRRVLHAIQEQKENFACFDYIFILNSEAKDIQYKDLLQKIKNIQL